VSPSRFSNPNLHIPTSHHRSDVVRPVPSFLLLEPPLDTLSVVRWVLGPFTLIPFNLVPCCSRKSVVAWNYRSLPNRFPDSPHGGLPRQMIQSSSSRIVFFTLSCSTGIIPSQTMTTGPWLSPQKMDEFPSPWVDEGPSYPVSRLVVYLL
jgi:hypothetical protein